MERKLKLGLAAAIAAAGIFLTSGCSKDTRYNVDNLNNIDATVTLFGDSLSFLLGHTEPITLENALNIAKIEGLDSLLKKDKYGNYSLGADGNYSLDEVISELHLEKLRDINGASFATDIEYKIGDFDPEQFKIDGKEFSYQSEAYSGFNLDDIPIPSISAPDQVIKAGLYKLLPDDLDIGKKIGNLEYSTDLIDNTTIKDAIGLLPPVPGDTQISAQGILETLGKASLDIHYQENIQKDFSLGEDADKIGDILNFSLKSGGTVGISLSAQNCPLTDGQIIPDLDLDLSSILVLADAGAMSHKVDLSSMVLNKSNGYSASKNFSISSLASGFPEFSSGKLLVNGLVNLDGTLEIQNAATTPNTVNALAGKYMKLKATITFNGVILGQMDIVLGPNVSYSVPDTEIPIDINYDLPEGIKSVDKVYFDSNKKLELSVSATSLSTLVSTDGTHHISLVPDIEVTFPNGLEVEGAVNNKIVISGQDLYAGAINKTYTVVSITPVNSGKKLTYSGKATAKVKATASGMFCSKYLPTSEANDVTVTAKINCTPALKDYDVTLDPDGISKSISQSEEFSFELEGVDDFGTFKVGLKNSPVATLNFSIPTTSELAIIGDKLTIALPQMLVVDGSGVSGFDAGKNTITINGAIPSVISLPIQYIRVTPQKEGGKTVVKGTFSITGGITVSQTHITRKTFDELKDKKAAISAVIPTLAAASINLEGDLVKSLDHEEKDVVFLDQEAMAGIPSEVKSLTEVKLDKVNALFEIRVTGLPDMIGNFVLQDTRIQLPDFLVTENDSHMLILDSEIPIENGKAVVQSGVLSKIANVKLEGVKEIKGDIKFFSSLYSHKPSVDVSTLQGTIKASVKIGVGNGTEATHPGKIAIDKASVRVGYDIDQTTSLSFGDIPAELQDEKVNFALNPGMHLELSTNFGAPVSGDFILTPFIGGKAQECVSISGIELPCSDDWNKTKTNKYAIGSNVVPAQDEILIASDLSPLLKRIPDSIQVSINAGIPSSQDCIIYPAATYNCNMKYDLEVPLSFGENFAFAASSDMELGGDISQYIKMTDELVLKGECKSTLPIGANCEIILLDTADKVVPLKKPVILAIDPSPDGNVIKFQNFEAGLAIKEGYTAEVRKIRFKFSIDASKDVNLRADQFIQISSLRLILRGGITINDESKN